MLLPKMQLAVQLTGRCSNNQPSFLDPQAQSEAAYQVTVYPGAHC